MQSLASLMKMSWRRIFFAGYSIVSLDWTTYGKELATKRIWNTLSHQTWGNRYNETEHVTWHNKITKLHKGGNTVNTMTYNVMDMIRQFHMSVKDRGSSTRTVPKVWSHIEGYSCRRSDCWPIQDTSGDILPGDVVLSFSLPCCNIFWTNIRFFGLEPQNE